MKWPNLHESYRRACTTLRLAQAEAPGLVRLLRRAARSGGRYLSALWNLRLGRPAVDGRRLHLRELNAHMLRDLNVQDCFHAQHELDRYEQIRAKAPLTHF